MDELTTIALVGTSKRATSGLPDSDHPAEALVRELAVEDRERELLLRAGARAVFDCCGQVARSDVAPLPACPAETCPPAPPKLVGLLQHALASRSWDLLIEFLQELESAGRVLPPELLPQALATTDASVRDHLLPVLGERGRWLSGFNTAWQWVTAGVGLLSEHDRDALVKQWDEGAIAERCRALRGLRRSDPPAARELLAASIDKEKADHRARLLQVFDDGLSRDDEALLEGRLDDRSETVRRTAAGLLAKLPQSAFVERMRQRAEAMLVPQTAGILRKRLKLSCRPPEKIDKLWERDGIPRKVPAGRGKRAVWVETVLATVPPSHWSRRFSAGPVELIEAVCDDDFVHPVLFGWTRAARAFAAIDSETELWLRPLWDHWLIVRKRTSGDKSRSAVQEHLQQLLVVMPDSEETLLPVLKAAVQESQTDLLHLLPFVPRPWSESFAGAYLATARAVLHHRSDNLAYQWASSLVIAGRALPPAALPVALKLWEVVDTRSGSWHSRAIHREIDRFVQTVRSRKSFYDEIDQASGSVAPGS